MTIALTSLGIPIESSRLWTTALVPRIGGGWNKIGQYYNYPDRNPTEMVVTHLETGVSTIDTDSGYVAGTFGHYCNSNFQIANQLRAPNGRVFFPAQNNRWWVYDPTTERVVEQAVISGGDTLWYSAIFNEDGSKLFGGTLGNSASPSLRRPEVFWIDPTTLAVTVLARVGSLGRAQNAYAYYLHSDGDWLYVLVGQGLWELVAIRISTGVATTLASVSAAAFASFSVKPEGLVAKLFENYGTPSQTLTQYWCIDGGIVAYADGYDPAALPFAHRNVAAYTNPLVAPPQIDDSLGAEHFRWRPNGSTGAWTTIDLTLAHVSPCTVESLLVLPNGDLLGNTYNYQGWFRVDHASNAITEFGPYQGVSGGPRLIVEGDVYITGYPNAPILRYDPTVDWSGSGGVGANPFRVGEYSDGVVLSGVKRGEVLAYESTGRRIYMVGERDRSGVGSGIGYYDLDDGSMGGTHTNLNFYAGGHGLAVFGALGKVVFAGEIGDDPAFPGGTPTVAQLVVYDLDLNEIERQTPIALLLDTGHLYRTSEAHVVVGLSSSAQRIYRWDIVAKTLLASVDLSSFGFVNTDAVVQDGDTITLALGSQLSTIDLLTLTITSLGVLANPALGTITKRGADFFMSIGAEVFALYAPPPSGAPPPPPLADPGPPPAPPTSDDTSPQPVSVAVSAAANMIVGGSGLLAAIATFDDASTQDVTTIAAWSSSDSSVVSVDAFGTITAVKGGAATITATDGSIAGSAVAHVLVTDAVRAAVLSSQVPGNIGLISIARRGGG